MKLRRAVEESGKKLESERANMENALRHIAQENEDIKKLLEREKEQYRLKDELYREQKKRNEAILLESQKVFAFFCIVLLFYSALNIILHSILFYSLLSILFILFYFTLYSLFYLPSTLV